MSDRKASELRVKLAETLAKVEAELRHTDAAEEHIAKAAADRTTVLRREIGRRQQRLTPASPTHELVQYLALLEALHRLRLVEATGRTRR